MEGNQNADKLENKANIPILFKNYSFSKKAVFLKSICRCKSIPVWNQIY